MCIQAVFMRNAVLLCRGLSDGIFAGEGSLLDCCKKPNIDSLAASSLLGAVRTGSPLVSGILYELLFQGKSPGSEFPFAVCDCGAELRSGDVCISCCVAGIAHGEEGESVYRADLTEKQLRHIYTYLAPLVSDDVFELVCTGSELCLIWRGGDVRGCSFCTLDSEPAEKSSVMPHGDVSAAFTALIERSANLLSDDYILLPQKSFPAPDIIPVTESLGISAALCGSDKAVRGLCRAAGMDIYENAADALGTEADVLFFDIDLSEDAAARINWLDGKLLPRLLSRTENILILPVPASGNDLCPPMPFLMHRSDTKGEGACYDAASCKGTGLFVPGLRELMKMFIRYHFE